MGYDRRECDGSGMGGCPYCGNGAEAISPWKEPITSPYRERVEQGLPPFEVDGDWPWNEAFFPKPSAIMRSEPQ
jgi:hypothetical protein